MIRTFENTLSEKPYVSRKDLEEVMYEYMSKDGKRVDRKCAFYDHYKMIYNDKLSKYEPFKKGKDGKHDPKNGELVYHVFLYTKSTDKEDSQTTCERRVIEKKQVIDGETQFIDDRNFFAPAYEKYLDFKKNGCEDRNDNEALKKKIAELQQQIKDNPDIVQKPKSIINPKDNSNDSSNNITKYLKRRKNRSS